MSLTLPSIDFLDEKGIAYTVKEFSPETPKGAENVALQFNKDPRSFIKTLVFAGKTGKLYLIMVGGDQNVNNTALKEATGEPEITMADPERIKDELGYIIGSIPPFALKHNVPVFIEESLQTEEVFGVGSGQWGIEIFIKPEDLKNATNAKYANLITRFDKTNWEELALDQKFLPRIDSASQLKPSTQLRDIKSSLGSEINITGWAYNIRSSGKIMFIQFRDGSGDIQVIVEKAKLSEEKWQELSELTLESSLQISGIAKEDKRSPFGYEMELTDFQIIQLSPEFPIGKKEHGPDFLLDNRHLWLRSSKQRAVLTIRDQIFYSTTVFLKEEGFIRVDTPIFQPVSCEDTSELFEVDYFGKPTYLTQSGQLYCEAAEFALGRTYDFGPVFRAEKSKTRKHLIEFWMMDAELPFTDLTGLMDFEERYAKRLISDSLKNCSFELKVLERDVAALERFITKPFIRLKHVDAINLLNEKFNLGLDKLSDIGANEEAKMSELYDMPVFIYDWPAEIKAFYMPKFNDGTIDRVRSVDLIAAEGFGEIMGGAEREFNYNKLLDVLEKKGYPYQDYAWYMDLRKYGTIPHCGFGLGLERFVRWVSGVKHIRETITFPRMLNRYYP
jgi:asparaginyl-tRNA synthetase